MLAVHPTLPRRLATLAISLALVAGLGPVGTASAATGDAVLLNEFVGSTASTDVEFIELFGDPGAAIGGLSVMVV